MHLAPVAVISGLLVGSSYAASVPANVKTFYNNIKAKGSCSHVLKSGFTAVDGGAKSFSYCGDHLSDYNVLYIQGTGGALADMDIDCDGQQGDALDDGRCGSSTDTQGETAFKSTIAGYNKGISDLNSFAHPYVVFGNEGTKSGYITFDPRQYGVEPLSVIGVVCNNQLFFGVWGDTNGDDGPPMVGEASISLATLCFGTSMNGNNGYSNTDVLYIAFPGSEAVPGANGAAWAADNVSKFESSLQTLGNKLIARIGGSSTTPTTTAQPTTQPTTPPTCSWAGHCAGASCSTSNDCSDALTCQSGVCADSAAPPPPVPTCSWAGHCTGASCSTSNDCSDNLTCQSGICAAPGSVPVCSWVGHCAGASCSTSNDCSDALTCQSGVCA